MNGWDFEVLWEAGRAALMGQDPYSVRYFYYPLPMAYLLSVFALLPQSVAFWLWLAFNLGLLIFVFHRQFWQWLLYAPILHLFSAGQVDLAFWAMARGLGGHWRGALLGALLTLKPQVALVLLPWHLLDWLKHDRRTLVQWVCVTGALWGLPLFWRPNWIADWLRATPYQGLNSVWHSPGLFSWVRLAPGLWPVLALLAVTAFVWGVFQPNVVTARATGLLASPAGLFYNSLSMLDGAPWWLLVPLSWLAVALALLTETFIPFSMLPLAVIGWQQCKVRKPESPDVKRAE